MSARQSAAVDQALKLIAKGMTAYAAAKRTGISLSAIYRACKRHGITTPGSIKEAPKG
jgi:hypothetical protein